ncbi:MAG TPA: type II toxin-antitoxin system HicB family antitoxin [Solirubrobacteraceae bacterium]|nr:type II toxin-antitoxin system HicB family antitoxin [Solirubrobacteraceae bacterium]
MRLEILIHQDGQEYWSEVAELPGCFASGRTLSELRDALAEAVGLYLWDLPAELDPVELTTETSVIDVRPAATATG